MLFLYLLLFIYMMLKIKINMHDEPWTYNTVCLTCSVLMFDLKDFNRKIASWYASVVLNEALDFFVRLLCTGVISSPLVNMNVIIKIKN